MRFVLIFSTVMMLTVAAVDVADAQNDPRERRRRFVEGILRTLVESQLEDVDQREGNAPPRGPQPPLTPALREARATLGGFSEESSRLILALREEEQLTPAIRPLLGDMLTVKAMSDALVQRGPAFSEQQLAREFQPLDRQWRVVSHRLRQIPNLDRSCLAAVEKLNAYDRRLCELLQVHPQLDRTELIRLTAVLDQSLQNLLEDLTYEPRRQREAPSLLLEGQKLQGRIRFLGLVAARNTPNEAIVGEYKQFYAMWRSFAAKVRSLGSPYLDRSARKVEKINDELHDLLWIPKQIDRGELLALARSLQASIDHISRELSLQRVLELPDPPAVVADILELKLSCTSLVQSIAGNTSPEELVWDVRLLGVEWQEVVGHLQAVNDPAVHHRLATADTAVQRLSETLGQQNVLDHAAAVSLAASVDDLADLLHRDLTRQLSAPNAYAPQFRSQTLRCAADLQASARHLHETVVRRGDAEHLRQHCLELAADWERMLEFISKFEPQHRHALSETRNRIQPAMAKLQVLYAY